MAQYKLKRDYRDVRYVGIWFLLTNILIIVFNLIEDKVDFKEYHFIFIIIFAILSIIGIPYLLLFIDGPLNKKLLDYFNNNPIWYNTIGIGGYIFCIGYIAYYSFTIYLP